jgi:transposase
MQTDGYTGYDALGKTSGIVHVGCFAHARRKFTDALKGLGKGAKKSKKLNLARQGLARINELFEIERACRDASPQERYAIRQEKLAPKLEALREWVDASLDRVPKDSLTGKAIGYLHRQWPKLKNVLLDGRLPIHTNDVERSIRPFAVGRRNWLFAGTPKGAKASASLYSLVETAKANGLDPWTYLAHVFERVPTATTEQAIAALLPWKVQLDERASITG